jgi:hypothetical protein
MRKRKSQPARNYRLGCKQVWLVQAATLWGEQLWAVGSDSEAVARNSMESLLGLTIVRMIPVRNDNRMTLGEMRLITVERPKRRAPGLAPGLASKRSGAIRRMPPPANPRRISKGCDDSLGGAPAA